MKAVYNLRPLINENDHVSLGFAGRSALWASCGGFSFENRRRIAWAEPGTAGLLHHLSILNVAGLLFGTIGGLGSLVAFFGLPQIRAYNRIGVFLSFFALFALALWLDQVARRYAITRRRAIGLGCACGRDRPGALRSDQSEGVA